MIQHRMAITTLVFSITIALPADADIYWECPKTFTMSSAAGISDRYNGTDYIRYIKGRFICDMKGRDTDECYFKYENIVEGDGAVVGFHRQKSHPKDSEVIVLDLRNRRYYKTFVQGDLRVTIFGDCQGIGENLLQTDKTLKDDAIELMGASVLVPGIAAYCNKYVSENEKLIEAAAGWNRINEPFMKRIIHVIESEGGLSKTEKETLDKAFFGMAKNEVEESGDKKAYCADAVDLINSGQLDLDKMEHTKDPLARVMGY